MRSGSTDRQALLLTTVPIGEASRDAKIVDCGGLIDLDLSGCRRLCPPAVPFDLQ
jgi:hypothetical protein